MLFFEIRNFFSRRGLLLVIVAALVLSGSLAVQRMNTAGNGGYTPADVHAAYAMLPSEEDEMLPYLERASQSATWKENQIYNELYDRITPVVNYQEALEWRLAETQLKLNSSFFATPGSFDYRSLLTVEKVYAPLTARTIQPRVESSLGIELATESRLNDVFLAFIALALVLGIVMLPKEEGSNALLKPMKNGHGRLLAAKLAALLLLLLGATILVYGANLCIGHMLFGLGDLSRPVQSLYGFSTCRYDITVGQYLLFFGFLKFLWIAALACLFFCVCVFTRSSFATYFAIISILGVQFLCFQSKNPWLHMTNLIWISDIQWYLSGYYNLNFFGYPVDAFFIALCVLFLLTLFVLPLSFHHFAKEETVYAQKKAPRKLRIVPLHTNLFFHEGYKLFIRQGAAILLAVFFVLQFWIYANQTPYTNPYVRYYAQQLEGRPGSAQEEFLSEENLRFEAIYTEMEHYGQLMAANVLSEETYQMLTTDLELMLRAEDAFRDAENQYASIVRLAEDLPNISFAEQQVYTEIWGANAQKDNGVNAMILAVVLALGLSAIFSLERNSNMIQLLHISPRRRAVSFCKCIWAAFYAVLTACIAFFPKIICLGVKFGYSQIQASAQSLLFLQYPFGNISIGQYIICTSLLWMLAACMSAALVLFISSKSKSRATAALAGCLSLLLPALLLWLG